MDKISELIEELRRRNIAENKEREYLNAALSKAEKAGVKAEEARVKAEEARVLAEEARMLAEKTREKEYAI